jgi:hypothetical protein
MNVLDLGSGAGPIERAARDLSRQNILLDRRPTPIPDFISAQDLWQLAGFSGVGNPLCDPNPRRH